MRVWSSMLYAFRRSMRGSFDRGRLPVGVRGPRWMTRLGVSLCAVAVAVAGLSMAVLPATASAEPLCTDSWTGPVEGSWQTASNWSKKKCRAQAMSLVSARVRRFRSRAGATRSPPSKAKALSRSRAGRWKWSLVLKRRVSVAWHSAAARSASPVRWTSPTRSPSSVRPQSPAPANWSSGRPSQARSARGVVVRCIRR